MTDIPATGRWVGGPPTWAQASGRPTVHVFKSADEAGSADAERIAGALEDAVASRGRADWVTTGGSACLPIYRGLSLPPLRDEVPWDDVHIWWGDDRLVPRDHPLSNRLPLDAVLVDAPARAGLSGFGEDAARVAVGREPGVPLPVA